MIRRIVPFCLGFVLVCSLLLAQEPPVSTADEPSANPGGEPPRLKKKKRDGVVPPVDPPKNDKPADPRSGTPKGKDPTEPPQEPPVKPGKGKEPREKPGKGKEPGGADEPLLPEDRPRTDPDEDEAEILERINKNMRAVEDKLGNRELGEATEQQQRDILNDIDALIRRSQQGGGGGGGGQNQNNQDQQNQDQQNQDQAGQQPGQGQQGGLSRAEKRRQERLQARSQTSRQQKQPSQRQQAANRPQRPEQKGEPLAGGKQPQPQPKGGNQPQPQPMGGEQPGAGRTGPTSDKPRDLELTKDIWGHLPESLRAEMNAYSNPQPFLPRYDDLIRKYYKAIAEKGRQKGD